MPVTNETGPDAGSRTGPRSVLIKLDGSAYSHVATKCAIQWAKQYGTHLHGLSVVDEASILTPYAEETGSITQQREEMCRLAVQDAERCLEVFAEECQSAGVHYAVRRAKGKLAKQVMREAQRHTLVLLGRELKVHPTKYPDSTLKDLLQHSPRPIVSVPLSLPQGTAVMIAYDASPSSARALSALVQSGLTSGKDVHVVTVHKRMLEAQADCNLASDYLALYGIRAKTHAVESRRSPRDEILTLIGDCDVGLLVAGCYGRSVTSEFLLGSNTSSLIKESPVPVFMFH